MADVSTWSFGYLEYFATTRNNPRLSGNETLLKFIISFKGSIAFRIERQLNLHSN